MTNRCNISLLTSLKATFMKEYYSVSRRKLDNSFGHTRLNCLILLVCSLMRPADQSAELKIVELEKLGTTAVNRTALIVICSSKSKDHYCRQHAKIMLPCCDMAQAQARASLIKTCQTRHTNHTSIIRNDFYIEKENTRI